MKRTKTICFANNKGGSGKSTTCANVGYGLSQLGYRVLLVDGDMQLNLSLSFFPEEQVLSIAQGDKNLYAAIKAQQELSSYILPTLYDNLDIIPSSTLMSSIELDLFPLWQRETVLQRCLRPVKESGVYDFILIDAPPTLGCWVMNLLYASDYLLIPVEASPWGLFGLANMFEFFEKAQQMSPDVSLLGIAITKVDERKNYFKQTIETLRQLENTHLFHTYIRVDSNIEWAQDDSKPVGAYKRSCRSAKEYQQLAEEVASLVHRKK